MIWLFILIFIISYARADADIRDRPDCDSNFLSGKYTLPHPKNCDQFYQCQNGSAQLFQCEDGYAYSPFRGCQLTHLVDCASRPNLQPPKSTKDCPRLYGIFQDMRNCERYLKCYNGTATIEKCLYGFIFDDKEKMCRKADENEKNHCKQPVLLGCNIGQNGQYESCSWFRCPFFDSPPFGDHSRHPFPGNCHHFVACFQDGTAKVGACKNGTAFELSTQTCEQEETVKNCKTKAQGADFSFYNIMID